MAHVIDNSSGPEAEPNLLQGYFDWQVTTLMLARDLVDPIQSGNEQTAVARRAEIEQEVRSLVMDLLPPQYKANPELDWPPGMLKEFTKATLRRAIELACL